MVASTDAVDLPDEGPKHSFFGGSEEDATSALASQSDAEAVPTVMVVVKENNNASSLSSPRGVGVALQPWGLDNEISSSTTDTDSFFEKFNEKDPYMNIAADTPLVGQRIRPPRKQQPTPKPKIPTFKKAERSEWLSAAPRLISYAASGSKQHGGKGSNKSRKRRNFHSVGRSSPRHESPRPESSVIDTNLAYGEDLYSKLLRSGSNRWKLTAANVNQTAVTTNFQYQQPQSRVTLAPESLNRVAYKRPLTASLQASTLATSKPDSVTIRRAPNLGAKVKLLKRLCEECAAIRKGHIERMERVRSAQSGIASLEEEEIDLAEESASHRLQQIWSAELLAVLSDIHAFPGLDLGLRLPSKLQRMIAEDGSVFRTVLLDEGVCWCLAAAACQAAMLGGYVAPDPVEEQGEDSWNEALSVVHGVERVGRCEFLLRRWLHMWRFGQQGLPLLPSLVPQMYGCRQTLDLFFRLISTVEAEVPQRVSATDTARGDGCLGVDVGFIRSCVGSRMSLGTASSPFDVPESAYDTDRDGFTDEQDVDVDADADADTADAVAVGAVAEGAVAVGAVAVGAAAVGAVAEGAAAVGAEAGAEAGAEVAESARARAAPELSASIRHPKSPASSTGSSRRSSSSSHSSRGSGRKPYSRITRPRTAKRKPQSSRPGTAVVSAVRPSTAVRPGTAAVRPSTATTTATATAAGTAMGVSATGGGSWVSSGSSRVSSGSSGSSGWYSQTHSYSQQSSLAHLTAMVDGELSYADTGGRGLPARLQLKPTKFAYTQASIAAHAHAKKATPPSLEEVMLDRHVQSELHAVPQFELSQTARPGTAHRGQPPALARACASPTARHASSAAKADSNAHVPGAHAHGHGRPLRRSETPTFGRILGNGGYALNYQRQLKQIQTRLDRARAKHIKAKAPKPPPPIQPAHTLNSSKQQSYGGQKKLPVLKRVATGKSAYSGR